MAGDDDAVDWFGFPDRTATPRAPVPCPRCGEPFTDAGALAAHAAGEHGIRLGPARSSLAPSRLARWWDAVGFLPLWLVLPLNGLAVALVVGWVAPVNPWWAAYAGGLATLPTVVVLAHRQGR